MAIHNVRETLLQGARSWLKGVLGDEFTIQNHTPDATVITENRSQDANQVPTPQLPYVVVTVPKYNRPISRKEDRYLQQGQELPEPVRQRTRDYSAVIRCMGVGGETEGWLGLLHMLQDDFNSNVATLYDCSEVQDISGPNEKGLTESRYVLDLFLEYSLAHETPQTAAITYQNNGSQP